MKRIPSFINSSATFSSKPSIWRLKTEILYPLLIILIVVPLIYLATSLEEKSHLNLNNQIIKDKKYGKIHHVHIYVGSNYKTWRDNNYLHSVSHSKKLGGGVVNELSHEIDYMIYLFNQPDKVMAFTHKEFWQPMDTYRELKLLQGYWNDGKAPWKIWE